MTLTSSNDSPRDTMRSFNRLVTTIRKTSIQRLIEGSYLTKRKLSVYYPDRDIEDTLSIEYLAVKTTEGNGVIHALIVGDYIPQKWLSDTWKAIHKAWSVDIRAPSGDNGHVRIARYILAQYVKGQSAIERVNCSKNWIYPGWRSDLKQLIKDKKRETADDKKGFEEGINLWTRLMLTRTTYSDYKKTVTLADYGSDLVSELDKPVCEYSLENYRRWRLNDEMSREL